jgi:hypothetical protein
MNNTDVTTGKEVIKCGIQYKNVLQAFDDITGMNYYT